jgi:hypothetical protein
MNQRGIVLAVTAFAAVVGSFYASGADERLVVFNPIAGSPTELDNLVRDHFANLYNVVDFTVKERKWEFPRGVKGMGPHPPVFVENRCISGSALVAYVISADGAIAEPYAVRSTHPLLGALASRSMSEWRFRPGKLDGREVPSLAATQVRFACPPGAK